MSPNSVVLICWNCVPRLVGKNSNEDIAAQFQLGGADLSLTGQKTVMGAS